MANIRRISQVFEDGKLKEAVQQLNNNSSKITSQSAFSLFCKCSIILSHKSPKEMKESELIAYLEALLKRINTLSDTEYQNYLINMYWVFKYLVQMNYWNAVLILEPFIDSPTFAPMELTKEHKQKCFSISVTIYHAFNASPNITNSLKIAQMILHLNHGTCTSSNYLDMCYNCALIIYKTSSAEEIEQYYLHAMDLLQFNDSETDTFPRFLRLFTYTMEMLLKPPFTGCSNVYKKITTVANKFFTQNHYRQAISVFESAVILFPKPGKSEENFTSSNALKDVIHTLDKDSLNYLYTCFYKLLYKILNSAAYSKWAEKPKTLQMEIVNFLMECEFTFSESHVAEIPKYFTFALDLMKISTYNLANTKLHFTQVVKHYTTLKKSKQIQVLRAFQISVYNFLIFLSKNNPQGFDFVECSRMVLILFEGSDFAAEILKWVISHLSKNGFYENCMAIAALLHYLCPDGTSNEFLNWCRAKAHFRENNVEDMLNLTMPSALLRFQRYINTFVAVDFRQMDETKRISLLKRELIGYKTTWRSKCPMFAVVKELYSVNVSMAVEMIVDLFDETFEVHDDFGALCKGIIRNYETNVKMSNESRYNLAILNYFVYKYVVKDLIRTNTAAVEHNQTIIQDHFKKEQTKNHVPQNANDCDVAANYDSLQVKNHLNNLQFLIKAADLLGLLIESNSVPFEKRHGCLNVLINIVLYFDLNKYSFYAEKSRQILIKLSECLEKNDRFRAICYCLKTMSIESLDIVSKDVEDVLENSEQSMKLMFFVNKTTALLKNQREEAAYECFKQIEKLLENEKDEKDEEHEKTVVVFRAQMLALKVKFVDELTEGKLSITELQCAYKLSKDYAYQEIYNRRDGLYALCVLLEICEEFVKTCWKFPFVINIRSHAKSVVLLCQKAVIPLPCIKFLLDITEIYIKGSRFEEGGLKCNELSEMLSLPSKGLKHVLKESESLMEKDTEIDKILHIEDLLRDVPISYKKTLTSPSSPIFKAPLFCLPSFLTHSSECFCYWCSCIEYQLYVLKLMHLKALNFMFQEQHVEADALFKAAIQIYDVMVKKLSMYAKKMCDSGNNFNAMKNHVKNLLEVNYFLLNDYSLNLCSIDKSQALSVNERLMLMLKPVKNHYSNLYLLVVSRRLSWMFVQPISPKPKPRQDYLTVPESVLNVMKTPETQTSQVVIKRSVYSPGNMNIKPKVIKNLDFDVSDDDEKDIGKLVVPVASRTPAGNLKFSIYSGNCTPSVKKSKEAPVSGRKTAKKDPLAYLRQLEKLQEEKKEKKKKEVIGSSRKTRAAAGDAGKSNGDGVVLNGARKKTVTALKEVDCEEVKKRVTRKTLKFPEDEAGSSKTPNLRSKTSRLADILKQPNEAKGAVPKEVRSTRRKNSKRDLFDEIKNKN